MPLEAKAKALERRILTAYRNKYVICQKKRSRPVIENISIVCRARRHFAISKRINKLLTPRSGKILRQETALSQLTLRRVETCSGAVIPPSSPPLLEKLKTINLETLTAGVFYIIDSQEILLSSLIIDELKWVSSCHFFFDSLVLSPRQIFPFSTV